MCLVCLLDMPYGYYELFRYVAAGSFVFFAITKKTIKADVCVDCISSISSALLQSYTWKRNMEYYRCRLGCIIDNQYIKEK